MTDNSLIGRIIRHVDAPAARLLVHAVAYSGEQGTFSLLVEHIDSGALEERAIAFNRYIIEREDPEPEPLPPAPSMEPS